MGFPGSNQPQQQQGTFKQKLLKVASLFHKKDDSNKFFISADDYAGQLFFQEKATGKWYKVKALGVYEPKKAPNAVKDLPANLCFNILINLTNPQAVDELQG